MPDPTPQSSIRRARRGGGGEGGARGLPALFLGQVPPRGLRGGPGGGRSVKAAHVVSLLCFGASGLQAACAASPAPPLLDVETCWADYYARADGVPSEFEIGTAPRTVAA